MHAREASTISVALISEAFKLINLLPTLSLYMICKYELITNTREDTETAK